MASATISYQWQRDGVDVVGATGATYTLGNADVGHTIDVVASYTDGHGTLESKASALLLVPIPGEIFGNANNNTLTGTNGNDVFQGFGGNDTIDGGLGNDRSVYLDATGGITVDLAAGTVSGPGVGTDTLTGIEQIQGSNFADHYSAAGFTGVSGVPGTPAGFNSFEGMGGDDVIVGAVNVQGQILTRVSYLSATAAVTVDIAAGTATGNASVGSDSFTNVNAVVGSAFNDVLRGSDNPNGTYEQYEGRAGDDLIDGRGGYDFAVYNNDPATTSGITVNLAAGTITANNPLDLSIGTDTLRGVEGVRGTNFDDIYNASGFSGTSTNAGSLGTFNNFDGAGGNDTIVGNGNTRIQYSNALAAVTVDIALGTAQGTVSGDAANVGTDSFTGVNSIMGSMFDDTLLGSGNNETFMGLAGNDFIDGRGGFDTALFNNMTYTTGGVLVVLAAGTVTGDASTGTDTLRSIEAVQGTNFADTFDATGYGLAGALNVGNNGNFNQFEGLGGNDTITGNGNTRLLYSNSTGSVTVHMAAGTADGDASVGHDAFSGVYSVFGSNLADVYDAANFIGISFGAYNEFQGQGGNDTITGNDATQIQYANATSGVTITIGAGGAGTATGDASVGTDTFTGVNSALGSNFADSYSASAFTGFNSFQGQGGNDTITGNGSTQIQFTNATSGVTITIGAGGAGTATGDASVGTDTFTGVNSGLGGNFVDSYNASAFIGFNSFQGLGGDDNITGNGNTQIRFDNATAGVTADLAAGNAFGDASVGHDTFTGVNSVFGSGFNDTILGSNANEIFDGGGGNDTINGAGGNDILTGEGGADTFVYADAGGADVIMDFNRAQGDTIDVRGVSGILTFADIQSKATLSGSNTIINFGGGNTLTLTGVASLQQSDFILPTSFPTSGTSGGDALVGTSHADTISGLDGNDIIKGLQGNDFIDGGTGRDVSDYSDATGGIYVDLTSGVVSGDASVGVDTLRSIEYVRGTNFNDTYVATGYPTPIPNTPLDIPIISSVSNTFEGGGGNDVIIGSAGSQASYSTGFGGTQISYAHASDSVTVDLLAGTARGTAANDIANVGVDSFTGVNAVLGSDFNDTLLGTNSTSHTDVFYGGRGNDFIDGRAGYDFVTYTSFLDPSAVTAGISVDLAAGLVTGDSSVGVDTLRSVELVRGTKFNDTYNAANFGASGFLNTSTNNVGDLGTFNQFEGMGGDDTITGNGNTRVDYNFALAAVTVDLAAGTGHSTVADNADVGNDTILGGVNSVRGSSFNDSLSGSANNENFLGGYGDDLIDGRGGFDRAIYTTSQDDAATGGITVDLAAGTVSGDASIGHDTLKSIEGITGTDFADTYVATGYGLAGALNVGNNGTFNEFEGGGGNDTVTGNGNTRIAFYNALDGVTVDLSAGTSHGTASGDVAFVGTDIFTGVTAVAGSAFDDTITGSINPSNTTEEFAGRAGNDFIDGKGGFDRAFYNNDSSATSGIHIDMASGVVTGDAAIGTDTLRSVESIRGTGFDDTYIATNFGNAGFLNTSTNDVGDFGTFNEFEGMAGNDTITGNGNTRIAFYNALAGVTVDMNAGTSHSTATGDAAGVGNDTFTGVNAVEGSNFNDTISGGSGNDTIFGRGGADFITGGAGADHFNFVATSDSTVASHDTIGDFVHGIDVIDTSAITGITAVQGLITGSTQVLAHSIAWIQSGADTFIFANSTGAAENQGSANMEIVLTNVTASTLNSADFFHF